MRRSGCLMLALGVTLAQHAPAQPPSAPVEHLPVEVALEASMAAYSTKPCADEMTVKFRAFGAGERVDTFVIRLQPGDLPRSGPRRMFLDLGQLKVYAERGMLTAISTAAPGKYAQMEYAPPLTPAVLATFLPPVPLPQLALAGGDLKLLRAPTPYTPDVVWTQATPEAGLKPTMVTMTGAGPAGPVTMVASAETGRLLKLSATIHGRSGDSVLELTSHPLPEPADPAAWAIKIEGRERVASVSDLKPIPVKRESTGVRSVPDLECSRPDLSRWSLHAAVEGQPPSPLVLLVFRRAATPERFEAVERDAKAALAALRCLHNGMPLPGEEPGKREPLAFRSASAVAIDLAQFSRESWEEARRGWGMAARERSPAAATSLDTDELMWAASGGSFMDQVQPGAGALALVIGPDRTIHAVVKLDGRLMDPTGIGVELRAALGAAPAESVPPPPK